MSITRYTVFALLHFVTWGIGPLQLVIHVVQNRQARDALGEDKQKAYISFKMITPFVYFHSCTCSSLAVQYGGFLPRDWIAAKHWQRAYFTGVKGSYYCRLNEGKLSPKRPLQSSKISYFKNEGKGKTFLLKMSFIYMIIKNSFSYQCLRT